MVALTKVKVFFSLIFLVLLRGVNMNIEKGKSNKLVYICAPLRGDIAGNIERAREYCKIALKMGYVPVSTHLMFDGILNDNIPQERQTALAAGRLLAAHCSELWVFTDTISSGMKAEIDLARRLNIPVRFMVQKAI